MQSLGLFAVHTSPEALSNLEDGQVLWLDLDGLVGLWVPSFILVGLLFEKWGIDG